MSYRLQGEISYKDRKKKFTFKESFIISRNNYAIRDAFDVEFIFLTLSDFGKLIEKKSEFFARGTIILSEELHFYKKTLLEFEVTYDFKQPYKKI